MYSVEFVIRYVILFAVSIILLRLVYYVKSPNRESLFSFFLFSNCVFLITYLLHNVELSMGFAFGLFAVFSMLRYRTETLNVRDMTYLFVIISLALICSVSPLNYQELCGVCFIVVVIARAGESGVFAPKILEKKIIYDDCRLIKPEYKGELIENLIERTGLNVIRVEVCQVNYLTDSAHLIIFYTPTKLSGQTQGVGKFCAPIDSHS